MADLSRLSATIILQILPGQTLQILVENQGRQLSFVPRDLENLSFKPLSQKNVTNVIKITQKMFPEPFLFHAFLHEAGKTLRQQ